MLFPFTLLHAKAFNFTQRSIILIVPSNDIDYHICLLHLLLLHLIALVYLTLRLRVEVFFADLVETFTYGVVDTIAFGSQIRADSEELTWIVHLQDLNEPAFFVEIGPIADYLFPCIKSASKQELLILSTDINGFEIFRNSLSVVFGVNERQLTKRIPFLSVFESCEFVSVEEDHWCICERIVHDFAHILNCY